MDDGRERYQRSVEAALTELREQLALYEPVIEAAKVWAQTAGNSMHGTTADLDLYEAVEALETAEGK